MFFITSTLSMTSALRRSLITMQTDLTKAQKELSTGRHADMSTALGLGLSRSFSLGGANETIATILSTNKLVAARLDTTQTNLTGIANNAEAMRATLIASANNGGDRQAIAAQARAALQSMLSSLNSSNGDSFIFGGENSGVPPLNNYYADPPAPNKLALDAAFFAAFGVTQDDPAVSAITPAQMQAFLDGPLAAQFDSAGWRANWSHASDKPLRSQVSVGQNIDASTTANDPALQKLAMAYAVLSDLGDAGVSEDTYKTMLQNATRDVVDAIGALNKTRARVGAMQNTVNAANDRMSVQSSVLSAQIFDLEAVDPTEAAARVNGLMTQIETSYALTARITQLSLTKYL